MSVEEKLKELKVNLPNPANPVHGASGPNGASGVSGVNGVSAHEDDAVGVSLYPVTQKASGAPVSPTLSLS